MSGYAFMVGACVNCGVPLTYSPTHVPSIRVDGVRQPLCRGCAAEWNRIHRTSKGLPEVPVHPNAYEPEPEENL